MKVHLILQNLKKRFLKQNHIQNTQQMNSKSFPPFLSLHMCLIAIPFLYLPYALTKEKKHRHLNSQGLSSQLSSLSNHPLPYPTCFTQDTFICKGQKPN